MKLNVSFVKNDVTTQQAQNIVDALRTRLNQLDPTIELLASITQAI